MPAAAVGLVALLVAVAVAAIAIVAIAAAVVADAAVAAARRPMDSAAPWFPSLRLLFLPYTPSCNDK